MTIPVLRFLPVFLSALTIAHTVLAGPADVVSVKVTKSSPRVYSFAATVRHCDTGWKHYADAWEVLGSDGKVLARVNWPVSMSPNSPTQGRFQAW
jgi:hypothetical protein